MSSCLSCGSALIEAATFCSTCGTRIQQPGADLQHAPVTAALRTEARRTPSTAVLRTLPWILLGMFVLIATFSFIMDSMDGSQSSLGPMMLAVGVMMFFVLRQFNAPRTLKLRFRDRQEFTCKLIPVLDRVGFKCSGSSDTGMDFGPKMALRAKLIGEKVILVDFVETTAAVVSGPKGVLTQIEKKLKAA
jgi:hypothetical protein